MVGVAWSAVWLVAGELVGVDACVVVIMSARVVEVSDGCEPDETVAVDEVESDDDPDWGAGDSVAVEDTADEDAADEGAADEGAADEGAAVVDVVVVDVVVVDVVVDELDSSTCEFGSRNSVAAEVGDADSMR